MIHVSQVWLLWCFSPDLTSTLSVITDKLRKDKAVAHALAVRAAWSAGNYRKFFKLYSKAPNMGGYLMDKFAPRERKLAIEKILKAYVFYLSLHFWITASVARFTLSLIIFFVVEDFSRKNLLIDTFRIWIKRWDI